MEQLLGFAAVVIVISASGVMSPGPLFTANIFYGMKGGTKHGPFLAGIFLSALNPFFIIWWLTIGFKLISDSLILWSFWGIGIMFLLHIWMDYAWLSSTAMISSRISKVLSNRNFKFLIAVLSIALVYFGITFLIEAFV